MLWLAHLDYERRIIFIVSEDGNHKWARKIGDALPIDTFVVKDHVFVTWERPEEGYHRLESPSTIRAQNLYTGELLWDWQDYILTILPFEHYLFIITYRNDFQKGFFIKTRALDGFVLWKVASTAPIISWDINPQRIIVKDSLGRVFILATKDGTIQHH